VFYSPLLSSVHVYSYVINATGCGCLLEVTKFRVFMQINYVSILSLSSYML